MSHSIGLDWRLSLTASSLVVGLLGAACLSVAPAAAAECLLDTNDDGIVSSPPAGDTDGGATSAGTGTLACGTSANATGAGSVAVGTSATATGVDAVAIGSDDAGLAPARATAASTTAVGLGSSTGATGAGG